MQQTFSTGAAFGSAIDSALLPSASAESVRAALVAGVEQGEEAHRSSPHSADGALNLRISNWVLRGQDTPILEIIGIVATAATAALAPGVIAAGVVITALSSFAGLCWKAWRKGAPLSKAEIAVLGFLKVHGPMEESDLKTKMMSGDGSLNLVDADVAKAILTLQQVQLRDGSLVSLIRKDAAGQWRAEEA